MILNVAHGAHRLRLARDRHRSRRKRDPRFRPRRSLRVTTSALNQAVERNKARFPSDFAFRVNKTEAEDLARSRSQSVTLKRGQNVKHLPRVFTEHGALMAANVLRSKRAIAVSVEIVRAFIQLRKFSLTNEKLARKIAELESRYDGQFEQIFEALNALLASPEPNHGRRMGFQQTKDS